MPAKKPPPTLNGGEAEWVSGYKLATHIGLSRAAVDQLAAQGILIRGPEGFFSLTANRLAYIKHLKAKQQSSAHQAAQIEYAKQKTEWLRQRTRRQAGELMPVQQHNEFVDRAIGVVLTELGNLPGAIAGRDLTIKRTAEAAVLAMRTRVAQEYNRLGDAAGEPPDGA